MFVDTYDVAAIAIDPETQKLYFTNPRRHAVEVINVDSRKRELFVRVYDPYGIVLDLTER